MSRIIESKTIFCYSKISYLRWSDIFLRKDIGNYLLRNDKEEAVKATYGPKYSRMDQVKFMNLKGYGLFKQTISLQKILKAVFHKFYLVRSWICCSILGVKLKRQSIVFLTHFRSIISYVFEEAERGTLSLIK